MDLKETDMEKEDKLIKELLQEGFLKTAPEGFTDSVMQRVTVAEQPKDLPFYAYLGIIFGATGIGLGLIYFTSPEFFEQYTAYFMDFLYRLALPFKGLFSGVSVPDLGVNSTFLGILGAIALLLGFDALISKKFRVTNIFL
jgi:hypothetical protein